MGHKPLYKVTIKPFDPAIEAIHVPTQLVDTAATDPPKGHRIKLL